MAVSSQHLVLWCTLAASGVFAAGGCTSSGFDPPSSQTEMLLPPDLFAAEGASHRSMRLFWSQATTPGSVRFRIVWQLGATPPQDCSSESRVETNQDASEVVVDKLAPLALYAFRLCVLTEDKEVVGPTTTGRTLASPAPAADISVTPISPTELFVTWIPSNNTHTDFRLVWQLGTAPVGCEAEDSLELSETEHTLTELAPETMYGFRVCTAGDKAYLLGPSRTATTLRIPPANPLALAGAAVSTTRIDLTWAHPGAVNTDDFVVVYNVGTPPASCASGIRADSSIVQPTGASLRGLQAASTFGFRVCGRDALNGALSPGETTVVATLATAGVTCDATIPAGAVGYTAANFEAAVNAAIGATTPDQDGKRVVCLEDGLLVEASGSTIDIESDGVFLHGLPGEPVWLKSKLRFVGVSGGGIYNVNFDVSGPLQIISSSLDTVSQLYFAAYNFGSIISIDNSHVELLSEITIVGSSNSTIGIEMEGSTLGSLEDSHFVLAGSGVTAVRIDEDSTVNGIFNFTADIGGFGSSAIRLLNDSNVLAMSNVRLRRMGAEGGSGSAAIWMSTAGGSDTSHVITSNIQDVTICGMLAGYDWGFAVANGSVKTAPTGFQVYVPGVYGGRTFPAPGTNGVVHQGTCTPTLVPDVTLGGSLTFADLTAEISKLATLGDTNDDGLYSIRLQNGTTIINNDGLVHPSIALSTALPNFVLYAADGERASLTNTRNSGGNYGVTGLGARNVLMRNLNISTLGAGGTALQLEGQGGSVWELHGLNLQTAGSGAEGLIVRDQDSCGSISNISITTAAAEGIVLRNTSLQDATSIVIVSGGGTKGGVSMLNGAHVQTMSDVTITSSGPGSHGISLASNSSVGLLSSANVTTTSSNGPGILLDGNSTLHSLVDVTVTTVGNGAHGLLLSRGSVLHANNVQVRRAATATGSATGVVMSASTVGQITSYFSSSNITNFKICNLSGTTPWQYWAANLATSTSTYQQPAAYNPYNGGAFLGAQTIPFTSGTCP